MAGAFGVAGHIGDGASVRAATQVNAAQASHEQVGVKWVFSGCSISSGHLSASEVLSPLA
jgi:hypothetical protein